MNELDVLRKTLSKQVQRIANLTLDLDLAHSQIEMLTEQMNAKEEETKAE